MNSVKDILKYLLKIRGWIIAWMTPIVLLPIPFLMSGTVKNYSIYKLLNLFMIRLINY